MELKYLFSQIRPTLVEGGLFQQPEAVGWHMGEESLGRKQVPNPAYPNEDYEQFMARMIAAKTQRIEKLLDVKSYPAIVSSNED